LVIGWPLDFFHHRRRRERRNLAGMVKDRKIMPLLQTPFDSASPMLSWDGQYLAFSANDSARYEIYVQRFQGGDSPELVGERRRVSYNGGNFPRWRRDGKELFFLSADGQIMAVAVKPGQEPEFGPPTALFRLSANRSSMGSVGGYEVSHDGQSSSRRSGKGPALRCKSSSTGRPD
jgi:eukaryotic-like serine/threonine-protein kinase